MHPALLAVRPRIGKGISQVLPSGARGVATAHSSYRQTLENVVVGRRLTSFRGAVAVTRSPTARDPPNIYRETVRSTTLAPSSLRRPPQYVLRSNHHLPHPLRASRELSNLRSRRFGYSMLSSAIVKTTYRRGRHLSPSTAWRIS